MPHQTAFYDLPEMLKLYETAVQSAFQSHGTRKDALRFARQTIHQTYPELKKIGVGSSHIIARFWKQTQTIIRKYYPSVPFSLPDKVSNATPAGTPSNIVPVVVRSDTFNDRYLDWISKHDYIPSDQFILTVFPGLDQNTINKAAKAAINDGYRFEQIESGYRIIARPSAKDVEVASIKKQVAELNARLSALFQ